MDELTIAETLSKQGDHDGAWLEMVDDPALGVTVGRATTEKTDRSVSDHRTLNPGNAVGG